MDIKRVSEYLGHHSAAFTLSIYVHLMPDAEERALRDIEAAIRAAEPAISSLPKSQEDS